MTNLVPESFPILRAAYASTRKDGITLGFDKAIEALAQAVAEGKIYNVVLNDVVKYPLTNAAAAAWEQKVNGVFTYAGKFQELPEEVYKFQNSFMFYSLHDAIAIAKKVAKTKMAHPMIDAMREVLAEAEPLAKLVKEMKANVVKGRVPKPVDPNTVIEDEGSRLECQICSRKILANTGVIAHHGYERPDGRGYQTNSCGGARELPYEASKTVLDKEIVYATLHRDGLQKALDDLHAEAHELGTSYFPKDAPKDRYGRYKEEGRVSVTFTRATFADVKAAHPLIQGVSYNYYKDV